MEGWELATFAFILLAFSAVARRLESSVVTAAIFFTSAGLLAGPALGLIDLRIGAEPVKLLAEATLTLVLFADASRISLPALRNEFAVPLRLLAIGLPLTILAGMLTGVAVLPGISLVEALVLSIMLACTDAALGQAVVTDERIPSRIRQGLNVESGLNDGICVPLFFIALAIAEAEEGALTASAALHLVLEEIGLRRRRGSRSRRSRCARSPICDASLVRRAPLVPDPDRGHGGLFSGIATGLGGSIFIAAFTGGFVFGVLRRGSGGEVSYFSSTRAASC